MFNLIATVLATVVMIAVSLAGLSYLGPTFGTATSRAAVAQVLNASQQVMGAEQMLAADDASTYAFDAPGAPATAALASDGYLRSVPTTPRVVAASGAGWTVTPDARGLPVVSLELDPSKPAALALCAELARDVGGPFGCTSDLSKVSD